MAKPQLFRGEYYLWHHVPSNIAAVIFAIMMTKSRTWFFSALVTGVVFTAQASAHDKTDNLIPSLIQNAFILLVPVFTAQGGAAGLMAMESLAQTSQNTVIAGLFINIIVFGFFMVTTVVFHLRLNKGPTTVSQDPTTLWWQHVMTLCVTSFLIKLRSIFRVIESI
ncbi:RTA1 like protein [Plectosphaerella cucumerina]|uniref:RTA1 like protein n=1 Tax=Plectosphaerella cucumerina TaxID=40658 RepID=A0A8K0TD69_9PEZI|nr:RTA1 like protein [Plectosphaerella cucumerina]